MAASSCSLLKGHCIWQLQESVFTYLGTHNIIVQSCPERTSRTGLGNILHLSQLLYKGNLHILGKIQVLTVAKVPANRSLAFEETNLSEPKRNRLLWLHHNRLADRRPSISRQHTSQAASRGALIQANKRTHIPLPRTYCDSTSTVITRPHPLAPT